MKNPTPMVSAGGKLVPMNQTDGIFLPALAKCGGDYRRMRQELQQYEQTQGPGQPTLAIALTTWLLGRDTPAAVTEGIELLKWLAERGDVTSKYNLALRTHLEGDTGLGNKQAIKLLEDVMAESTNRELTACAANLYNDLKDPFEEVVEEEVDEQAHWSAFGTFMLAVWTDAPGFNPEEPNIGPHLFGGDDEVYFAECISRQSVAGTLATLVANGGLKASVIERLETQARTAAGRRYIAHQLDRRQLRLASWIDGTAPYHADPAQDPDFMARDQQVPATVRTSIGTFQDRPTQLQDLLLGPHYKRVAKTVKRMGPTAAGAREATAKDVTVPERALAWVGSEFPGFFKAAEACRRTPMLQAETARWHPWCYLPGELVARALSAGSEGGLYELQERLGRRVHLAQAVNAWRMTKAVYRFDPTMLQALLASKPIDKLPHELFLRMPDWCGYVPTPGIELLPGVPMRGFFVHLEDESRDDQDVQVRLKFEILVDVAEATDAVLLVCIDGDPLMRAAQVRKAREMGRAPTPKEVIAHEFFHVHKSVQLGRGTFGAAVSESGGHLLDGAAGAALELGQAFLHSDTETLIRLAKIALYLCSEQADVSPKGIGLARDEQQKRQQRGQELHPAKKLVSWGIGYRIGSKIRKGQDDHARKHCGTGETGSSKRPHMRDAHYHLYWTGPKTGQQIPRIHWLSPIAVMAQGADDLITTVRPVTAPE